MRQKIVIGLKKVGLFRPIKTFKDYLEYNFKSREEYYSELHSLYGQFNLKGKLVFDIGAADDGIEPFLREGARVIGVEPTARFYNRLKRRYSNSLSQVIVLKCAVGPENALKSINVCNSEYFSTFDEDQIRLLSKQGESRNLEWYKKEEVQMYTLDKLIELYGLPDFCKIDVEGYESSVFEGLSKKIPLISFEYNTLFINKAIDCIMKINKLGKGKYGFNFTRYVKGELGSSKWMNSQEIIAVIKNFVGEKMEFGDIYAKLKGKV